MKEIEFPTDINGKTVKLGDKIRGFGVLKCQGNFQYDLTPVVTANIQEGILFFGNLSAKSFSRFEILKKI